jgi:hypothetical protein
MRFFVKPTTEGMVLGFAGEKLGDVHLTIYFKGGRVFSHVTDQHRPLRPWNLNFDEKLLSQKAERAFKRWIRSYSPNKYVWIMTSSLRHKLLSQFPRQEGRIKMPVEMVAAELVFDRDNPKRWRKLRIRELLGRDMGPGLTIIDGTLHWVHPIDSKKMLAYTDRQFERYWGMIFREFGLDKYLEYVASAYPEVIAEARRKVKRLSRR